MDIIDALVIGAGQSGLAAARALTSRGVRPVLLEAGTAPTGSWPLYYDSLTLFSPARYSSMPGVPFPGDGDRYPCRDEVVDYLDLYARRLDVDIRFGHRVAAVTREDDVFTALATDGQQLAARTIVAATGSFSHPHLPALPGLERFTGTVMHVGEYRNPKPFSGQRVVVVGAGNSAVQVAAELAGHARVTIATRGRLRFAPQRPLGHDLHFWYRATALDRAPIGRWLPRPPTVPVLDTGRYRSALASGRPDHRPLFSIAGGNTVAWPDGLTEAVDTIILATGYRPALDYVAGLGVLDPGGRPRHRHGLAVDTPGLAFVGLEWQRSLASASLRGVGDDAARVADHLRRVLAR